MEVDLKMIQRGWSVYTCVLEVQRKCGLQLIVQVVFRMIHVHRHVYAQEHSS